LAARRKRAQALALRARIVLACAEDVDEGTVSKWRRRFVERRIDGLHDEPRSGAPARLMMPTARP
jgi:transposase